MSDILNIMGRVARLEKIGDITDEIRFNNAKRYAESALENAKRANDQYRLSEAYLTLAILYYNFRALYKARFNEFLKISKNYLDQGNNFLIKNKVMNSIAVGVRGDILYAQKKTDEAFDLFYEECKLSIDTKHMRLPRALELLTEKLMDLEVDQANRICNKLSIKWEKEPKKDLYEVCKLIKEYRPYILEMTPVDKIVVS